MNKKELIEKIENDFDKCVNSDNTVYMFLMTAYKQLLPESTAYKLVITTLSEKSKNFEERLLRIAEKFPDILKDTK